MKTFIINESSENVEKCLKNIFSTYFIKMNMEGISLYDQGVNAAKKDFVKGIYLKYFRLCLDRDRNSLPPDIARVAHIHDLTMSLTKDDLVVWLITINPPSSAEVTWETLEKLYDLIFTYKNFLREPQMVLEQRSTDIKNPYGHHMHIACGFETTKADVIRRCYAGYKRVIGDHGDQVIHVNKSPKAYDYVSGIKTLSKLELVEIDNALKFNRSG